MDAQTAIDKLELWQKMFTVKAQDLQSGWDVTVFVPGSDEVVLWWSDEMGLPTLIEAVADVDAKIKASLGY